MTTIKLEQFNNCPGKDSVEKYFNESLSSGMKIADANQSFYQNKSDTLVLKINRDLTKEEIKDLYLMPWKFQADEFNTLYESGSTFVRIWWD